MLLSTLHTQCPLHCPPGVVHPGQFSLEAMSKRRTGYKVIKPTLSAVTNATAVGGGSTAGGCPPFYQNPPFAAAPPLQVGQYCPPGGPVPPQHMALQPNTVSLCVPCVRVCFCGELWSAFISCISNM